MRVTEILSSYQLHQPRVVATIDLQIMYYFCIYHRNLSLKKTLKDYVIIKEKLNCVLVFIIFDLGWRCWLEDLPSSSSPTPDMVTGFGWNNMFDISRRIAGTSTTAHHIGFWRIFNHLLPPLLHLADCCWKIFLLSFHQLMIWQEKSFLRRLEHPQNDYKDLWLKSWGSWTYYYEAKQNDCQDSWWLKNWRWMLVY